MAWRAEQGLRNGGQVMGYDLDSQNKGILKPNKEEAELVNLMFRTYLETKSFRQTAEVINNKGYRTKSYTSRRGNTKGGNLFIDTTISHILYNPVYIGKIAFKDKIFEGKHEPVVSLALWDEVQKAIGVYAPRRAGARKRTKHTFLLEGLLRCGWCDSYMTPIYCGGKDTYFYYQCTRNGHLGNNGCQMKYVPAEAIEETIVRRIKEISKDFNLVNSLVSDASRSSKEEIEILKKRKQLQEEKLAPLKQNIANWLDLIGNGTAKRTNTTEVLLKRMSEATQQEKQIEGEITEIDFQIKEVRNKVINAEVMRDSLVKFVDLFEEGNDDERKDLMRLIVHKVIWTPEEIKYALYDRPVDTTYIDNPDREEALALSSADAEPLNELRRETSVIWLTEKIYYHSAKRRRKIGIGIKPEKPQRIKTNPILQALKFQELLSSKEVKSKNELARKLGLSRVRMTQMMNLLKLNPEIIQKIYSFEPAAFNFLTERRLRPLTRIRDKNRQIAVFRKMLQETQLLRIP